MARVRIDLNTHHWLHEIQPALPKPRDHVHTAIMLFALEAVSANQPFSWKKHLNLELCTSWVRHASNVQDLGIETVFIPSIRELCFCKVKACRPITRIKNNPAMIQSGIKIIPSFSLHIPKQNDMDKLHMKPPSAQTWFDLTM